MKCVKCQNEFNSNEQFCHSCGTVLTEEKTNTFQTIFNPQENIETLNTSSNEINNGINSNFNETGCAPANNFLINSNNTFNKNDQYVKAYIGKNYEKIWNNKWSWPAFLMPVIYLIYRKYWKLSLYAAISFIVITSILSLIGLDSLSFLSNFIVGAYFGLNFNFLYKKYVEQQVNVVINQNPNASQDELLKILSQKGKPAKWVVWYFIPIIFIAIILYIIFLVMAPGIEVIKNISSVIR